MTRATTAVDRSSSFGSAAQRTLASRLAAVLLAGDFVAGNFLRGLCCELISTLTPSAPRWLIHWWPLTGANRVWRLDRVRPCGAHVVSAERAAGVPVFVVRALAARGVRFTSRGVALSRHIGRLLSASRAPHAMRCVTRLDMVGGSWTEGT